MTINFFATRETKWNQYLLNSPCFATWTFVDEDPEHSAAEYKCHFVQYLVFPNEELRSLLRDHLDGGDEYLSGVQDSFPDGSKGIVGSWTYSGMLPCLDVDRNRNRSLIRWREIDWDVLETYEDCTDNTTLEEIIQEGIEEAIDCGYPDVERLRAISEGQTVYGFSSHDFRYIEGCPMVSLERTSSGGFVLSHIDESNVFHKQRYFFHSEGQARKDFWEYLQEQGVKPEEN